jgi:hypothetical protein
MAETAVRPVGGFPVSPGCQILGIVILPFDPLTPGFRKEE